MNKRVLTVIKLGGSVTDSYSSINRIVSEIVNLVNQESKVLIIHGGGAEVSSRSSVGSVRPLPFAVQTVQRCVLRRHVHLRVHGVPLLEGTRVRHRPGVVPLPRLRQQGVRVLREGGERGPELDHPQQVHCVYGADGHPSGSEQARQRPRGLHPSVQALWRHARDPFE